MEEKVHFKLIEAPEIFSANRPLSTKLISCYWDVLLEKHPVWFTSKKIMNVGQKWSETWMKNTYTLRADANVLNYFKIKVNCHANIKQIQIRQSFYDKIVIKLRKKRVVTKRLKGTRDRVKNNVGAACSDSMAFTVEPYWEVYYSYIGSCHYNHNSFYTNSACDFKALFNDTCP